MINILNKRYVIKSNGKEFNINNVDKREDVLVALYDNDTSHTVDTIIHEQQESNKKYVIYRNADIMWPEALVINNKYDLHDLEYFVIYNGISIMWKLSMKLLL